MLSNLSRKVKKVSQSFGCKGHNAKILISFLEGCTQTLNNKCCLWYVLPARSLWLLDFHRQWSKPPVAETNGNHKCYCLINEELSTFCYLQRFFKCQGSRTQDLQLKSTNAIYTVQSYQGSVRYSHYNIILKPSWMLGTFLKLALFIDL